MNDVDCTHASRHHRPALTLRPMTPHSAGEDVHLSSELIGSLIIMTMYVFMWAAPPADLAVPK